MQRKVAYYGANLRSRRSNDKAFRQVIRSLVIYSLKYMYLLLELKDPTEAVELYLFPTQSAAFREQPKKSEIGSTRFFDRQHANLIV